MDLRATIMSGHSTAVKNRIVKYVSDSQSRLDELMQLLLAGDNTLSQRAAWPLGDIGVKYPGLMVKHIPAMVKKLRDRRVHDAIPRNFLRVFQHLTIPEKYCSGVLDLCFDFVKSEAVAPAIRAYAVTVAAGICKRYAAITPEFEMVLNEIQQVPQPPAVNVRIKRAMNLLRR